MSPEEKPPEDTVPDPTEGSSSEMPEVTEKTRSIQTEPVSEEFNQNGSEPIEATIVESSNGDSDAGSEPRVAEFAAASVGDILSNDGGATLNPSQRPLSSAPPIAGNLENMSANGGAIGSLVLGIWCVIGSFITNWSIINGVLGLLMGFWGLTSRKQRTAWIGIALCVLGIFMSLIQVGELINAYLNAVDETPY